MAPLTPIPVSRLRLKCDGTRAETRFRLSPKRTSPFKSAGASVPSTTGSRGVRISGSNAGYTMFRGSVKSVGYLLHSPVSPLRPLPCVTVCHHISTLLYLSLFCTLPRSSPIPISASLYCAHFPGPHQSIYLYLPIFTLHFARRTPIPVSACHNCANLIQGTRCLRQLDALKRQFARTR